jgi:hypothetical protein
MNDKSSDTGVGNRKKLPQNIHALIGEIGEKQVLLRLCLKAQTNAWQVFHNLGEAGYDVLLLNPDKSMQIRIEVKTRQRLYTTRKKHQNRPPSFYLTDIEYQSCDFLVAYYLDRNEFYIVPKEHLERGTNASKVNWRFRPDINSKRPPQHDSEIYLNAWHRLHSDFRDPQKE